MVGWIKMVQSLAHCVRWGPSSNTAKGAPHSPQFSAHVHCAQTAAWIKMPLGMELGLRPGHIVLDGDLAPPPKKGHSQFSAIVCCGQTAGWIKMPLGMQVCLGLGHIVLDGDQAPSPKMGWSPPLFSAHVYCGQTATWIKMPLVTELGLAQTTLC